MTTGNEPITYTVQKGDTLSGILLDYGFADTPQKAAVLAEEVAERKGLPIYGLGGWSELTGVSPTAIQRNIANRFGDKPAIRYVHLREGDKIVYDGNRITVKRQPIEQRDMSKGIEYYLRNGDPIDLVTSGRFDRIAAGDAMKYFLEQVPGADVRHVHRPRGHGFVNGEVVGGRVKVLYQGWLEPNY